ncbi:MAG: NnrU family protein [Kiloniellales bacterium]
MEQGLSSLVAATATFVGSHFVLSSQAVRQPLIARLGERPFRGLYALLSLVVFIWMVAAYGRAPQVVLWPSTLWARHIPLVVMPIAAILAVAGLTTRNVTMVGAEASVEAGDPAPGIMRVTRHPFLWAVAVWAISHLAATGDAASLILMGGILVLALGGMAHIDARRRADLGSAWGPIALTTSVLPFAAVASGRASMDWAGIGWQRLAGGVALYFALFFVHELVIGVSPLPG